MGELGTGASGLARGHGGHGVLGAADTVFRVSTAGLFGWSAEVERFPAGIPACPRCCVCFLKMGTLSTKQDVAALKSRLALCRVTGFRHAAPRSSRAPGPTGWLPRPQGKLMSRGTLSEPPGELSVAPTQEQGRLHLNPTCSITHLCYFPRLTLFSQVLPLVLKPALGDPKDLLPRPPASSNSTEGRASSPPCAQGSLVLGPSLGVGSGGVAGL